MKKFDILPDKEGKTIRVIASTKVGFVTAALEGMFAVARPRYVEPSEEKRAAADTSARPFSVTAGNFKDLMVRFLESAWEFSGRHKEAFAGPRFSLITDIKTEGELLGLPVTGFGRAIKGVVCDSPAVQKNQVGNWEAQITFRT
jgi:hypothetical protein